MGAWSPSKVGEYAYLRFSMRREHAAMILACAIALFPPTSSAVSIGAGPSTIDYGHLIKGGYAERTITVSTNDDQDLDCHLEFTGDIKDWISTDKGTTFKLPSKDRVEIRTILQPPLDSANGIYEGAIYIRASPKTASPQGTGLTVGAGVITKIIA